jgi:arsenate reductase
MDAEKKMRKDAQRFVTPNSKHLFTVNQEYFLRPCGGFMKKIYHLGTCTTCQRILKELKPGNDFVLQDIKTEKITPEQIDEMKKLAGSYEALFSRIALKYRSMGLNEMELTEKDCRRYILDEYTFLKRPVIIIDKEIFIGNSPKTVAAAKIKMHS